MLRKRMSISKCRTGKGVVLCTFEQSIIELEVETTFFCNSGLKRRNDVTPKKIVNRIGIYAIRALGGHTPEGGRKVKARG